MRIKWIFFLIMFVGMAVIAPVGSSGLVLAAEIKRVAVLFNSESDAEKSLLQGMKGYLDKQGTTIEFNLYPLQNNAAKPAAALQEIQQQGADMLVALGSQALLAVCKNTDLPVIASMIMDKSDLDKCPNLTGVALDIPLETQFDWLKQFFPEAKTVGVIYNPVDNSEKISSARQAAKNKGFKLVAREVSDPKDLPDALDSLQNEINVLWGISDSKVLNSKTAKSILLFSFRNRIPFVGLSAAWVKAGAFYALDRDYADIGRQCGEMTHKVLTGKAIDSIAAAEPQKVTYAVNLKATQKMKVDIPDALIKGATKTY
jgi:putative ABC transport system substrate-binding protein